MQNAADLDRRTLLRAAAWSVPLIGVAVATPLAAASEEGELTGDLLYADWLADNDTLVVSFDWLPATSITMDGSFFTVEGRPDVSFTLLERTHTAPGEALVILLSPGYDPVNLEDRLQIKLPGVRVGFIPIEVR